MPPRQRPSKNQHTTTTPTKSQTARSDTTRRMLKTSEVVALEIVRGFVQRGMTQGDKLPQETELLRQYQVSRSSLREALRLLETQGLIAIRPGPGSGTVVGKATPHNLGRTMTLFLHMADVTYDELLNMWILTEPLIAQQAAMNPDSDLKKRLLSPFIQNSKESTPEMHAIPRALNFHDTVSALADNGALSMIFQAISFIVSDHMLLSKNRRTLEDFILDEHSALAKAIIAGKPLVAHRLMTQHVQHVADDFKTYWPQRVNERVSVELN